MTHYNAGENVVRGDGGWTRVWNILELALLKKESKDLVNVNSMA